MPIAPVMMNTTQRIGAALLVGGLFAAWIGENGLWLGVAGLGLVLLMSGGWMPTRSRRRQRTWYGAMRVIDPSVWRSGDSDDARVNVPSCGWTEVSVDTEPGAGDTTSWVPGDVEDADSNACWPPADSGEPTSREASDDTCWLPADAGEPSLSDASENACWLADDASDDSTWSSSDDTSWSSSDTETSSWSSSSDDSSV